MTIWNCVTLPWGLVALCLGGALGALHRAVRSQTQETWSEIRLSNVWRVLPDWRFLPSAKTVSDLVIGGVLSMALPALASVLPFGMAVDWSKQHPGAQFAVAYGIAFIAGWEATLKQWKDRARRLLDADPAVKNAAPAPLPAQSRDEVLPPAPTKDNAAPPA